MSQELLPVAAGELTGTQRQELLEQAFRVVEALDPETEWLANIETPFPRL